MYMSEQTRYIKENFDLSDRYTCKVVASLLEAGKDEQLLSALSSALYDKIVTKVDEIDFGTIPLSRGDITKVEKWAQTEECMSIMRQLIVQYKQDPAIMDVVITAAQNIKDRKALFIKAYHTNSEFPMLLYNLIVLAIERSVSLMIATCIQIVKDPSTNTPVKALDKVAYQKTMDDVMYKQLITFNNQCKNGIIDKTINEVLKKHTPALEAMEMDLDVVAPVQDPNAMPENPVANEDPFDPDTSATADYAPQDNTPCQGPECQDINPDELPGQPGEFPEDVPQDNVEPDNIPTVVPGDDITADDSAINEEQPVEEISAAAAKAATTVINALPNAWPPILIAALVGAGLYGAHKLHAGQFLIDMLRSLVYSAYYSKLKFKEYLEVQADLLEANADELEDSMDPEDKKTEKIIRRQRKFAEKLRKWANKFSIDSKESSNKSKKEAEEDKKNKKKIKKDENGDDVLF